MKNIVTTALVALSLTGCATAKRVAAVAVVESDRVADDFAMNWRVASTAQIAHCREVLPAESSKAQRVACLGPFAPDRTTKIIAGVKTLIAAQLAVQVAVECEAFKGCPNAMDWAALSADMVSAWEALKPYVEILKNRTETAE